MDTQPISQKASPWHAGEQVLQESVGVAARMEQRGHLVVRDHLIAQHRDFYPLLSFIILGAVDPSGEVWATIRTGRPGFAHAIDDKTLHLITGAVADDPAEAGLAEGNALGLLGIELSTRRRNRLNGTVRQRSRDGFDIAVEHSFGNCPQYIRQRADRLVDAPEGTPGRVEIADGLDAAARHLIASADTFFVASYVDLEDGPRQVDVSHRGGKSGFVRVNEDGVLTIPDFAGNLFFNTLGNFLLNPRAGLLFVDFERGDVLQLSGEASVVLDGAEIGAFQGAERLWRFKPTRMVRRSGALPLRWQTNPQAISPNVLLTGSWDEAEQRLAAAALKHRWRPFRIADIVDDGASVRSFHLFPTDGAGLVPPIAGQYLPIRVRIPDAAKPLVRTYTLSSSPSADHYRISVKRQGIASRHLHETMNVGDRLDVLSPAGGFTMDAALPRPAVLLAGGIGITPMLAMLNHIVSEGKRTRRTRPTWLFYSSRSLKDRAFSGELQGLVDASQGAVKLVRLLSDPTGAAEGLDYDRLGRIDMQVLTATLPFNDYDFYVCGPPAFMQSIYDGLRRLNIAEERIHTEAFGPSSFRRATALAPSQAAMVSTAPVRVTFAKSGRQATWQPGSGSLLDLAEGIGLEPAYGCRNGGCGSCRAAIRSGAVAYERAPSFVHGSDEALICCAAPAKMEAQDAILTLDL